MNTLLSASNLQDIQTGEHNLWERTTTNYVLLARPVLVNESPSCWCHRAMFTRGLSAPVLVKTVFFVKSNSTLSSS